MKKSIIVTMVLMSLMLFSVDSNAQDVRDGSRITIEDAISRIQSDFNLLKTRVRYLTSFIAKADERCGLPRAKAELERIKIVITKLEGTRLTSSSTFKDVMAIKEGLIDLNRRVSTLSYNVRIAQKKVSDIAFRLKRIEKRVDDVNRLLQNLEGEDRDKLEKVVNRVNKLLEEAKSKFRNCEMVAAASIIKDIESIGKKVKVEINKKIKNAKRIAKYIKRNSQIIEKAKTRVEEDKEKKLLALAVNLHRKSKEALKAKKLAVANRLAINCREKLIDLGKTTLTDSEKEQIKKRVASFYKNTVRLLKRAEEIATRVNSPELNKKVELATKNLEKAQKLHKAGRQAAAMELLKRTNRIAKRIVKTASVVRNIDTILEKLEKRLKRVAGIVKKSDDKKIIMIYKNALSHFKRAKSLAKDGKNVMAAKEARIAIKLLGKVIHVSVKDDPKVREEIRKEVKKVSQKVLAVSKKAAASDSKKAKVVAKRAVREIAKARTLAKKGHFKQGLAHIFKAAALAERVENILAGNIKAELEEDADLDKFDKDDKDDKDDKYDRDDKKTK